MPQQSSTQWQNPTYKKIDSFCLPLSLSSLELIQCWPSCLLYHFLFFSFLFSLSLLPILSWAELSIKAVGSVCVLVCVCVMSNLMCCALTYHLIVAAIVWLAAVFKKKEEKEEALAVTFIRSKTASRLCCNCCCYCWNSSWSRSKKPTRNPRGSFFFLLLLAVSPIVVVSSSTSVLPSSFSHIQ